MPTLGQAIVAFVRAARAAQGGRFLEEGIVQTLRSDGTVEVRVGGRVIIAAPRSDEVLLPGMAVNLAPAESGPPVIIGAVRG